MLFVVFAMVVAACSSDSEDTTTTAADAGGGDTATTTTAASGGDDTATTTAASGGDEMVDVSGTEVSVFAAPTGDEGASIQATFDVYSEETGSRVTYEGSDDFEGSCGFASTAATRRTSRSRRSPVRFAPLPTTARSWHSRTWASISPHSKRHTARTS
jgi:hypothetical protein